MLLGRPMAKWDGKVLLSKELPRQPDINHLRFVQILTRKSLGAS